MAGNYQEGIEELGFMCLAHRAVPGSFEKVVTLT
jgi:hypothetical protein